MTLYLYNYGGTADPTALADWWTDQSHTVAAEALPTSTDTIYIDSNVYADSSSVAVTAVTVGSGVILVIQAVTAATITFDGGMGYGVFNGHVIAQNGGYVQQSTVNGNLDIISSMSPVTSVTVNGDVTVDSNSSCESWDTVEITGNLTITGATVGGLGIWVHKALDATNGYLRAIGDFVFSTTSSLRLPGSSVWLHGADSAAVGQLVAKASALAVGPKLAGPRLR